MFDKDLKIPINLLKAEALERRTDENHPCRADLKTYIKNLRSGYNGERTISYFLSQIPPQRFRIFHDLRLPYGDTFFQIDTLILSTKFILMLDGKNHSGKLHIDKEQMVQEYMDNRNVYENPIIQANRHNILLQYFLEKHKLPQIPIESLVVICKSSTEVTIDAGYTEAYRKICRASDLVRKMEERYQYYRKEYIDNKTVEKIKKLLLKKHTPLDSDLLEKFNVSKREIKTGVQCPKCFFIPMNYKRKNWICPTCKFLSPDAFLQAMIDYFLLINPSFTNKELRKFLHLPNSRSATYFIYLLNFPSTGTTKGRIYHQPKDFL